MKLTLVIAGLFGVLVAAGLVLAYGLDPILRAVAAVGWGAVVVALIRSGETAGAGLCWWILVPHRGRRFLGTCVLLRWVRESINMLLPVAQVGGDLIGARLLAMTGVPGATAGASVLVDILLQTVSQFFFTLVGLALLASVGGGESMVRWVLVGLAVLGPGLLGFFAVLRFGGVRLVERILRRIASNPRWGVSDGLNRLHEALQAQFARRSRLAAAFSLHSAIWFLGTLEIWTALGFMGHPVSYGTALVIESLGQAVRGAAFVVPGAVGVQEAGFVALCAVFGIPAPAAVALSLVKRLPEIVLGIPGLFIWQGLESRNLLASRSVAGERQPAGE